VNVDQESSLFRYLCERPYRLETTVTEGLAYLLKTRRWAKEAIHKLLESHGYKQIFTDFDCESQYQFESGPRPDLALLELDTSSTFALLELKIDAIFTTNQPNGYVRCLIAKRTSKYCGGEILLFIVPKSRRDSVWKQVNARLDLEYVVEPVSGYWLRVNNVTVAIVEWNELLRRLEKDRNLDDREAEEIITVMKDKTEQDLIPEVPPIDPTIIENKSTALEVLHYMQLAETINKQLEMPSDEASTALTVRKDKAAIGHGYAWTGRYYYCADYESFWVGFAPEYWSKYPISPIWIAIESSTVKDRAVTRLRPAFAGLIDAGEAFFDTKPMAILKIPIRLKAGAGGDELVTDALEQISKVLKLIASSKDTE
jgi:hypothetical protein